MTNIAHPKAVEEWSTKEGTDNLIRLWDTMPTKPDTEKLIADMVERCPEHSFIVDLGCGPGRKLAVLPEHRTYRGYDVSELFIKAAIERYGNDSQHSFQVRNLFDGAPNRRPSDVLLCIDVAQHYPDPLDLLRFVSVRWPAHHYIFTILHGPERVELLNGYVVATTDLDSYLAEFGSVSESHDAPLKGFEPLIMRYVRIDKS
jgi:SAM-dependent methyltransferase